MPPTLFADPSAAFVPVDVLLPTAFNAEGWSEAKLVCTDGRGNIWPHCYIAPRPGRPGYWLQVGSPHAVNNVTHWRDYPAEPAPALTLSVSAAPTTVQCPADEAM